MPERKRILLHSRLQTILLLAVLAIIVGTAWQYHAALRDHSAAIRRSDLNNAALHARSIEDRARLRRAVEDGRADRAELRKRLEALEERVKGLEGK
jgi:hypothetical protein